MTRSDWICNACGEGFETKGRRDGHRERIHRQRISMGMEDGGMERSETGKFVCECGKNYLWPRSLRRHQRNCITVRRMENRENSDADDADEGMGSIDEMS